MKISNFYLPILAATTLAFAPLCASARDTEAVPTRTPGLDLARELNQAFVHVAEDVSPCVVVITVTEKASSTSHLDDSSDTEQDPLEPFRRFLHPQQDQQPQEKTTGQGSGIIIRKDGYILTNRHVVEDAEKIEVRLKDGRTFRGEVRGEDAPADVAVIKIEAKNLPVAKLADSSKTRVGEFAIAIGAPFALDYSVTFGHVSAKDRTDIIPNDGAQTSMLDQSFIQTDANINPGNSGGPLVNIDGEVIGINTLIRGLHTGIGFAIPINLAREIADKLISDGKYSRSWLGVSIFSLREYPEFRSLVKGVQDGVVVHTIVPTGPAAQSNLKAADVITAVDGKPVVTSQQLKDEIRAKKAGQEVVLDVLRRTRVENSSNGSKHVMKALKITVRPLEWVDQNMVASNEEKSPQESSANTNPLGIKVKALTSDMAKKYNVDLAEGVIVTYVERNSIAAQSGIQEGDIITSIEEETVTNPKQFQEAIKGVDMKKGIIVHVISDGTAKFEILKEQAD
ncbi:MAG TPA: trypsin-like peptidase domain-containing protein [Verrucomicrobiae bacterium]|nr:trypsin-like peptidase domain-containing protein [Verrucomicrobiae bacterium]